MNRENGQDIHEAVYAKNVLEFVTVASEYCGYLEIAESKSAKEFAGRATKILALLYLKASMLEKPNPLFDESVEAFVSEEDYHSIRNKVAQIVGAHDDFLEVFHEDIQYSDGPVRATISEDLADIYQYLKNFTSIYALGIEDLMHDGLAECMQYFEEYWGQKLVNVLRALHQLKYQETDDEWEQDNETKNEDSKRNFFTRRQADYGEEFDERE